MEYLPILFTDYSITDNGQMGKNGLNNRDNKQSTLFISHWSVIIIVGHLMTGSNGGSEACYA